jgi:triacylglycerol esterase/lipase EstA (alpha/beta hydrolase family)
MRPTLIALACAAMLAMPGSASAATCRPTAAHPYPVVLVHGTFENSLMWAGESPQLKAAGNNATGDIPTSAGQLGAFVDQVLAQTGAAKVDLVGHSQGGMMPRYWMKFSAGASKVDDLIGIAPSNHGTTNPLAGPAGPFCKACAQQAAGSAFITNLNAGGDTLPGVSYTVISTRYDEVVTPYQSQALVGSASQVTNVVLQTRCPFDISEHLTIPSDPATVQWVLNALGRSGPADPGFRPRCL